MDGPSITIIKSNHCLLLALSLVVTIIISGPLSASCNVNVNAQTRDVIMKQRKAFENNPQIAVGDEPYGIAINEEKNKVYITNINSGTVSEIDSNSGSKAKDIRVGDKPTHIVVDSDHNKIYVTNMASNTVSIIDGNNDSEIGQIPLNESPFALALVYPNKIYVTTENNTVSVIDVSNNKKIHDIPVSYNPADIAVENIGSGLNKIYVTNNWNNTVSVINATNDKKMHNIKVGDGPGSIAIFNNKIYVTNERNNTVSVIISAPPPNLSYTQDKKELHDIKVGFRPNKIVSMEKYLLDLMHILRICS